jgi:hypothetical protein
LAIFKVNHERFAIVKISIKCLTILKKDLLNKPLKGYLMKRIIITIIMSSNLCYNLAMNDRNEKYNRCIKDCKTDNLFETKKNHLILKSCLKKCMFDYKEQLRTPQSQEQQPSQDNFNI